MSVSPLPNNFDLPCIELLLGEGVQVSLSCHLFNLFSSLFLRKFAEFVERKLKAIQVFCAISLISEDQTIPQVVEVAAKKQCLFAIVVNSQNEVHQSLTVNILHGTPQGMSLACVSFVYLNTT